MNHGREVERGYEIVKWAKQTLSKIRNRKGKYPWNNRTKQL